MIFVSVSVYVAKLIKSYFKSIKSRYFILFIGVQYLIVLLIHEIFKVIRFSNIKNVTINKILRYTILKN